MVHSVITPRVIIAMQMWLNLGINIKISMLGTIPMHELWRNVVLFIIKHNEKSIIPNPQIEQGDKQVCVIEENIGSVALAEIHVFFSFVFGKLFSIYMQSPK
jgi:hypothetical protein